MPPSALPRPNDAPAKSRLALSIFISSLRSIPAPSHSYPPPLSRDPLPDIRRAVSEFSSPRFVQRQELYGFAVHEKHLIQVDGHCALFPFQQGSKHVHILSGNASADS